MTQRQNNILTRVGFGVIVTVSLALLGFTWNFSARFSEARAEILTNKRRVTEVEVLAHERDALLRGIARDITDIRERVARLETHNLKVYEHRCEEQGEGE